MDMTKRAAALDAAVERVKSGMALFEEQMAEAHRLAAHPAISAALAAYEASPGPAGIFADLSSPAKARAKRAERLFQMRKSAIFARLRGRPRPPRTENMARAMSLRASEKRLLIARPRHSNSGFAVMVPA